MATVLSGQKVLIVDDEEAMRFALSEIMEENGLQVLTAASPDEALQHVESVDVVVTDFAMPGRNGLELLDEIRALDPDLPVIMITAHGSERIAVQALKRGAYDYISKPFDNDEVAYSVRRACETRKLRRTSARVELASAGIRIVGQSPALQRTLQAAMRLADKDVSVLVRGETGTGKELFASLLHAKSRRAGKPLIKFNCAAIPHDLAEAQLFGYARGAFTGASNAHQGYFVQADGGTLVLDEIGELALPLQSKLLRVLQEQEVQPLGSTRVEKVDFRLVASTHRDLAAEVKAGRFREDLYYRIAVVELLVPSLRERREDIPLLAREFARKYSERFGLDGVIQLAPELLPLLEQSSWPGNVRQLENAIARCVALATGSVIGPQAFELIERPAVGSSMSGGSASDCATGGSQPAGGPLAGSPAAGGAAADGSTAGRPIAGRPIAGGPVAGGPVAGGPAAGGPATAGRGSGGSVAGHAPDSAPPPKLGGPSFREQMEAFERNLLVSALAATQNNQSEAARRLGMNRATLYDRLKRYSLLPDSAREG